MEEDRVILEAFVGIEKKSESEAEATSLIGSGEASTFI